MAQMCFTVLLQPDWAATRLVLPQVGSRTMMAAGPSRRRIPKAMDSPAPPQTDGFLEGKQIKQYRLTGSTVLYTFPGFPDGSLEHYVAFLLSVSKFFSR